MSSRTDTNKEPSMNSNEARIEYLGNRIARLDELADEDATVRAEQQRLQAELRALLQRPRQPPNEDLRGDRSRLPGYR